MLVKEYAAHLSNLGFIETKEYSNEIENFIGELHKKQSEELRDIK